MSESSASQPAPVVAWEPPPRIEGWGGQADPGAVYRPARTLARVAAGLIGLSVVLYLLDALVSLYAIGLVSDLDNTTEEQLIAVDTSIAFIALGILGTLVLAGIAFLAWLRRVVANVPALDGGKPDTSPNMAIVWWFIPFANLIKPHSVVSDIWRRLALTEAGAKSGIVTAWWILYLAGNIVGQIYARLPAPTTVASFNGQMTLSIIDDVLVIISGVLAIEIILRVERRSRSRAARLAAASTAQPAAASAPAHGEVNGPAMAPDSALAPAPGDGG